MAQPVDDLNVERWSESTPNKALNKRDFTAKATFDGKKLTLADGRSFSVVGGK